MARTITSSMAGILEKLELEDATYVTHQMLENLVITASLTVERLF